MWRGRGARGRRHGRRLAGGVRRGLRRLRFLRRETPASRTTLVLRGIVNAQLRLLGECGVSVRLVSCCPLGEERCSYFDKRFCFCAGRGAGFGAVAERMAPSIKVPPSFPDAGANRRPRGPEQAPSAGPRERPEARADTASAVPKSAERIPYRSAPQRRQKGLSSVGRPFRRIMCTLVTLTTSPFSVRPPVDSQAVAMGSGRATLRGQRSSGIS